jgi:hypothetical protein
MRNDQAAIEHERVAHKGDEKPPKFAAVNSPNPAMTAAAAEHTTGYNKNRPTHRRNTSHREQSQPLSPEVGDVPEPKWRGSSGLVVISAVVTAALPVVMWLLGRTRTHRPA